MNIVIKRVKKAEYDGDGMYNLEIKGVLWADIQAMIRALDLSQSTGKIAQKLDESASEASNA